MFKEIRRGLAASERNSRHIAQTRRLIDSVGRDSRRRGDQLDEMNRLDRERAKLSRQLLDATTTLEGEAPPAYVAPRDIAAVRRRIEAIDARLMQLYTAPAPTAGVLDRLGADLKVEMSVIGHQLLLMLGIVIANILFFGLLILIFPYVWDWFWSFP